MMRRVGGRAVVLAVLATTAMALLFVSGFMGRPGISDTGVYRGYGERISSGDIPYRDFAVEYPPGAFLPFVVPVLVADSRHGYDKAFAALMGLSLVAISALLVLSLQALRQSGIRIAASVGAFLLGVLLLGPFVFTRFDLYAAAFTLASICAILYRRERLGSVLLGIAIATKLYPLVLVPLLVSRSYRRDGPRAGLATLGRTGAAAVAVYLPFVLLAPEGVVRSVWRQLGRPLQIESLGSGVLLALHQAVHMPLDWASGAGSQNLTGTVAAVASALTTIAGIVALGFVWWRYVRGDTQSAERFARYAAAAVTAFVAFGKVLSPQFLVWLLAIVVLVAGLRGAVATALLLAACLVTRMWFPGTYWELVKQFDPTASWLVIVRDILLVAVFVTLVKPFTTRERAPQ